GDGDHRIAGHGLGPCTLHNPTYDFNDALIAPGAALWVKLAEKWLAPAA
ncbi:MAG TPA: amidohydrolase, partial [Ideonella sp.]|nr:amidohydrolase [Ideonella sp.]